MKVSQPTPITEGVFQLRVFGARVTVLVENGEALLVDAGLPGSLGAITRGLEVCGASLDQIGRVVVTHAHPDHSGGLAELVSGRRIAVAAHRLEADIITGAAPAPSPLRIGLLAMMADPVLTRLMGDAVPVDDLIEDGDVVPFRTEVRVVHLPGHTPGSIALHLPEKRTVVIGDALQYKLLGGLARRPPESPSSRGRQCNRSRSFSTWTSTPYASATFRL